MVIVGISSEHDTQKLLYSPAEEGKAIARVVDHINAYLVPNFIDIYIAKSAISVSGLTEMPSGSKMTDGSNLVFTKDQLIAS